MPRNQLVAVVIAEDLELVARVPERRDCVALDHHGFVLVREVIEKALKAAGLMQ